MIDWVATLSDDFNVCSHDLFGTRGVYARAHIAACCGISFANFDEANWAKAQTRAMIALDPNTHGMVQLLLAHDDEPYVRECALTNSSGLPYVREVVLARKDPARLRESENICLSTPGPMVRKAGKLRHVIGSWTEKEGNLLHLWPFTDHEAEGRYLPRLIRRLAANTELNQEVIDSLLTRHEKVLVALCGVPGVIRRDEDWHTVMYSLSEEATAEVAKMASVPADIRALLVLSQM